jgi:imidazoleglycerol-phosphate dehydratase
MSVREAQINRRTNETEIEVSLRLDGAGRGDVETGLPFLDHMIVTLARHARFDLTLACRGDLAVDDHHTSEDCALALGTAVDQALGERRGIARFGHAYAPLDEALARATIDLSGRPYSVVYLGLARDDLGGWAVENIGHFFQSFATAARATLHVELVRGVNDHHRTEAAFKSLALALRQAVARDGGADVPSTKGTL